jgi:hypothetical protein
MNITVFWVVVPSSLVTMMMEVLCTSEMSTSRLGGVVVSGAGQ